MTFGWLLLRNLFYHWRGNLAVLLGVVVGTAVLTGALLVGDSLRGSLRDATLQRLGWVDQALVAGRFFRQKLASELAADGIAPAVILRGAVSTGESGTGRESGKVTILGVDDSFWSGRYASTHADSANGGVKLNASLARELAV